MLSFLKALLTAGSPPHYVYVLSALLLLLEDGIARSRLRANSTIQLVFQLLELIPGFGQVVAKLRLGPKGPAAVLLPFLIFGALLASACASPFQSAKLAEGAAAKALGATAIAWVAYDAHHQDDLIARATSKDEAIKMIVAYRNQVQAPVQDALHVAGAALKELDTALGAADAVKRRDFSSLIADIYRAASDLVAVLRRFDIPIPLPQLGGVS